MKIHDKTGKIIYILIMVFIGISALGGLCTVLGLFIKNITLQTVGLLCTGVFYILSIISESILKKYNKRFEE